MGAGGGGRSDGPEEVEGRSATITTLMCSGNVGPKSSSGTADSLWTSNMEGGSPPLLSCGGAGSGGSSCTLGLFSVDSDVKVLFTNRL